MVSLFISHSSRDKVLVESLIQLLHTAFRLRQEDIRATSVPGYGLPGGSSTDDHLRSELNDAAVVVGLISKESVKSTYVIFELGARWGSRKPMVPLLAPGFDPGQLEGPLRGINCLDASSATHLDQLLKDLSAHLGRPIARAAALQIGKQIADIVSLGEVLRESAETQKPLPKSEAPPAPVQPDLESQISRLARVLDPLPPSHTSLLRALASGPQVIKKRSAAKDSLYNLKLIKLVGEVDRENNLYEAAVSEKALTEYFRRQRAKRLPGLLRSISPAEKNFFNLFLLENPFQQLANARGVLPSDFYYASSSLQEKELLVLSADKDYVQTLTLPDDVARLLPEVLGKPILRTEAQLDLNKVAAAYNSGGGA